jgi:hypothetical protein
MKKENQKGLKKCDLCGGWYRLFSYKGKELCEICYQMAQNPRNIAMVRWLQGEGE